MKKRFFASLRMTKWVIVVVFLLGVNCEMEGKFKIRGCEKKKVEVQKENPTATDFTLKDLQGNEYTLSKQRDKVVIIDFWATWCKPCVATIPIFNELHQKYEKKGLLILGIGLDGEEAMRRFIQSHKISYPVLIGNQEIARKYEIYAIPRTFVIDKEGKIASRHLGLEPGMQSTLDEEIQKLLK